MSSELADQRIPEPELMVEPEQAAAYAAADFAEPHQALVDDLVGRYPELARTAGLRGIDLGCGPGDVLARLALALPQADLTGVDGSPAMLALAPARLARDGVADRVRLEHRLLPDAGLPAAAFGLVVATSVLHHLADPGVLWATVAHVAEPGAVVWAVDLRRPPDEATVVELVRRYAAGEPEVLRRDFAASLRAAWRPDEVEDQLADAGLGHLVVEVTSDRHLRVSGRR